MLRCFVPGCDNPTNPNYNEPWVHNVIPGKSNSSGLFEAAQCERYELPHSTINETYECYHDLPYQRVLQCNRWVFDPYEKTIVEDWSITCRENQYLLALVGTAHFAGIVFGSALAGILADK